jgi:hypothetical protein
MADYDGLTPGQVLADASVAEFIKSLGIGIADAQRALDENSVDQIAEFIEPREGLDGNTLLSLGLSPAFYHYQHADISCSLQLSLKVEKNFSLGLNLNGSFNSTSSESDAALRQATLEITTESTGTLTVKEKAFPISGDTHPKRMRNLQKALIEDTSSGIALALYHLDRSELEISSDAEPEKVHVTNNTVAFLGGGSTSGIIRLGTNADTSYVLNDSTTINTTAQASLSGYGTHVKTLVDGEGYTTRLFSPNSNEAILTLEFDTSSHIIEDDALQAISAKLMFIAMAIKANSFEVEVEGFADRQQFQPRSQNDLLNKRLGLQRADYLEQLLIANGAPANKITSMSEGDDAAEQANDSPGQDNQLFRKATVKIKASPHHWLFIDQGPTLSSIAPDMQSDNSASNGFTFVYNPPSSLDLGGKKVTVDSVDFDLSGAAGGGNASGAPSAFAHNLAASINANSALGAIATSVGNITTISKDSDKYNWTLATIESGDISLAGTDGITVTSPFPRATTSGQTTPRTGNRSVAVGASLDVGFARKFEMNVTGNSTISARLVSIPAPPEFLATIKEFLNTESGAQSDG